MLLTLLIDNHNSELGYII